jgi:hypothetical protein
VKISMQLLIVAMVGAWLLPTHAALADDQTTAEIKAVAEQQAAKENAADAAAKEAAAKEAAEKAAEAKQAERKAAEAAPVKPASADPRKSPPKSAVPSAGEASDARPDATRDPESLKLHLMDGSVITGRLSLKDLSVETKFGMLNVPVANVRSFTPGLTSHPALAKQIASWIEDLGSGTFNDREAAQQALLRLGPSVRAELERRRDDSDAERRTRVKAILSEFEQAQEDADDSTSERSTSSTSATYIQDDSIVTSDFTIVGRIVPQSFDVSSLYGPLTVKLADIRRVDRDGPKKEELPTNFTVTSAHIVQNGTLNTNIRLERGDSVTVSATGSIVLTPWGNQASSGPDGASNYGTFNFGGRPIPIGALIAKVGNGEEYFKIGSRQTFTAAKTGPLILAIAMHPGQAGNEFPGQYKVKVHVQRKQ